MPDNLSEKLLEVIKNFDQERNAVRISRNLRKVFFDYLRFQNTGLDVDFDLIIEDVEAAIKLFELIADETKSRHT